MADAVAGIAQEAGAMALDRFDTDFQRWEKTPGSPVCEVDLDVDAMLKAQLSALLPDAGWLSEETADNPDRLARDRVGHRAVPFGRARREPSRTGIALSHSPPSCPPRARSVH